MESDMEKIKRDAYTKALKFKNTGMDEDAIYAWLEKQGVPVDIAKEVAKNVLIKLIEDKTRNFLPMSIHILFGRN